MDILTEFSFVILAPEPYLKPQSSDQHYRDRESLSTPLPSPLQTPFSKQRYLRFIIILSATASSSFPPPSQVSPILSKPSPDFPLQLEQ